MKPIALRLPILPTICAIGLAGCASNPPTTTSTLLKDSLLTETPTAEADVKQHTGIDYRKALEAAAQKDPMGLHELFLFTDSNWFIGALADDHCITLHQLLRLWGDRAFSVALTREAPRLRKAVISALDYDGTWNSGGYPLTYALAPHPYVNAQ